MSRMVWQVMIASALGSVQINRANRRDSGLCLSVDPVLSTGVYSLCGWPADTPRTISPMSNLMNASRGSSQLHSILGLGLMQRKLPCIKHSQIQLQQNQIR